MVLDEQHARDAEHFADIHQRLAEYDRLLPHERVKVTTAYMDQFVRDVQWLLKRLGRSA